MCLVLSATNRKNDGPASSPTAYLSRLRYRYAGATDDVVDMNPRGRAQYRPGHTFAVLRGQIVITEEVMIANCYLRSDMLISS